MKKLKKKKCKNMRIKPRRCEGILQINSTNVCSGRTVRCHLLADLPSRGVSTTVISKAVKVMAKEKAKKKSLYTTLFVLRLKMILKKLERKCPVNIRINQL